MLYPLKVKHIEKSTSDCSLISFEMVPDLLDAFAYKAGQYLTLESQIKGEKVRRCYSLCSAPYEKEWKVGVKKVEGGAFSVYANDVLQEGDIVSVMPPLGNFTINLDPSNDNIYVAFAAGSGITPVISVIKDILHNELKSSIQLYYFNSTAESIILKSELDALKNVYIDRFEVFYFLTQQKRSVDIFNGRLNQNKLEELSKSLLQTQHTDHFFICGPEPMIRIAESYLSENNISKESIHFELFNTDNTQSNVKKEKLKEEHQGQISSITIHEGGKQTEFSCIRGESTILDEAMKHATDLPYACKGGVCATCIAKLVYGKVHMLKSYGLEQEQIDEGYILTCQSVPISEKIEVDYDI